MPFRFPLIAVLRYRQSLERQQEIQLLEANQKVAAARYAIEDLDRAAAEADAREAQQLAVGISAAELQFSLLRRSALSQRRKELEKELAAAEEICASRRLAFQHARQQHQAVDTLRRHQLELYNQQEQRLEQRRLDDLFLLRRDFLSRG